MRTIYIAGPMRGYAKFNFAAFDKARDKLVAQGWKVLSPADLDRAIGFDENDETEPSKEFLNGAFDRDIKAIRKSDAIYMLSGWENSTGATAEYWVARWLHLEIIEEQESILSIAQRVTSGDRRRDYGSAKENHDKIADMWNTYLMIRKEHDGLISASDVAAMMILLKLARHANSPKKDNFTDIAGYAKCLSQIEGFES